MTGFFQGALNNDRKRVKNLFFPLTILLVYSAAISCKGDSFSDSGFRFKKFLVEYAENPVNIDIPHPRFSWIAESDERGAAQKSYRILVGSAPGKTNPGEADIWDSGEIMSDVTIQHPLEPGNLKPFGTYFWRVIVTDNKGQTHSSPECKFETAFLPGTPWSARWIGSIKDNGDPPSGGFYRSLQEQYKTGDTVCHDGRSLLLRHEERIHGKVRKAKAFVCGLGLYEFYVNGKRIGDNMLAPAKTPYHKYVLYDTYDITGYLEEGMNVLGIQLGNGWYNPYKKWWNDYRMQWFGHKKAIAEIHLVFDDGSEKVISTGDDWYTSPGPVLFNCIYDGEIYDARREQPGWNEPGFDRSLWQPAVIYESSSPALFSHRMPSVKVNRIFKARELQTTDGKARIFDMGQNFAGKVSLTVNGQTGTRIRIRFAEDLKADSTLDVTSNENAKATAEYILKGGSEETYSPVFSYFGFRYVEISFEGQPFKLEDLHGEALWSANRQTGSFSCGNDLVVKIHNATLWSQRSNMLGYPMDCPQRDERLGWLGDAQVTCEEALFNFDMALFYDNWLQGISENQDSATGDIPVISPRPYIRDDGVEWSSTYLFLLWQYYTFYGDTALLEQHYQATKNYLGFLRSRSAGMIIPSGWIGDWGSMAEGWKEGDPVSVPTGYYFLDAKLMTEIAAVLGKQTDKEYFGELSENIAKAYNEKFFDPLSGNYNDGSQMANSFPFYLGIVPGKFEATVTDNLVRDIAERHGYHFSTGVLGTRFLPEVLADLDRCDIVWKLINQRSSPSWFEMMKKYNTMCEFWTLKQSKNHVMMGSIDAWFYRRLAGIRPVPEQPGFARFIIRPYLPEDLDFAEASSETIRGEVFSGWKKENSGLTFRFRVPFGTRAEVYIPGGKEDILSESGLPPEKAAGVSCRGFDGKAYRFELASGTYVFRSENKK